MKGSNSGARGRTAAAGATLTLLAAVVLLPARAVPAGATLVCGTPHVAAVAPQIGHPGDVVTVAGSGFASYTCALGVTVGGQKLPVRSQNGDGSLTFTATAGLDGPVSVSLTDALGGSNVSNNNLVYATVPTVSGLSPTTPAEGQAITITGAGFTFGGLNPAASAQFLNGGGSCQSAAPSVQGDGTVVVAAPTRYCNGAVQLTFNVVVDTSSQAVQPVVVGAGAIDIAPVVTSSSPQQGVPGTVVTVSGSGFSGSGAATVGSSPAPSSWQDHGISVTVPAGAVSGPITLVRGADGARFTAGAVTVVAAITSVSPGAAGVGDTVTIAGGGFGVATGEVHLGALSLPVQRWSPTSIVVSIPPGAASGALSVIPVGNAPSAPAALTIVPRLTGVTPSHALAGAVVQVSGTSLGTGTGTVAVGGHPATVTLWADDQVGFVVPSGLRPGAIVVVVTPVSRPGATIGFTVDAGALSPAAQAAALASAGIAPPPIPPPPPGQSPTVTHGGTVDFHPQRKPPSPINLTLTPSAEQAEPGSTVQLTASLIAYGKPVVGAPIDVIMVVEPDTDVVLAPAHAVTDARGEIHSSLRLSKTAGDHIVLARSSQYSDEIRIRGGSESALASTSVVGRSFFWAITACVLLFLVGFALNLATSPDAARAAAGVWKRRERTARGTAVAIGGMVASVVRAAVWGWRATIERLIDRLRHLRGSSATLPPM